MTPTTATPTKTAAPDEYEWMPDNLVSHCPLCHREFNAISRRKHHCRDCGKVICDNCSHGQKIYLRQYKTKVRVCYICGNIRRNEITVNLNEDVAVLNDINSNLKNALKSQTSEVKSYQNSLVYIINKLESLLQHEDALIDIYVSSTKNLIFDDTTSQPSFIKDTSPPKTSSDDGFIIPPSSPRESIAEKSSLINGEDNELSMRVSRLLELLETKLSEKEADIHEKNQLISSHLDDLQNLANYCNLADEKIAMIEAQKNAEIEKLRDEIYRLKSDNIDDIVSPVLPVPREIIHNIQPYRVLASGNEDENRPEGWKRWLSRKLSTIFTSC